ncbi:YdjY domain-containing protein [Fimbriiglobus ruber]|uniref:Uncharacterized protein n=1 Tax=Fimbriiglobus ruber TaxID=1908690 RepID=A0A225DQL7_9BACT|nr:YdjY domain-containing protein [Fimbriiglobus ruber]OWK38655.1 hypothetical protein FRUB_07775 [Fimbriiglobus ruber]
MLRPSLFAALGAAIAIVAATATGADDKTSTVTVDKAKKLVIIPAKIAPRKLAHLDQVYPIEVIATWAYRDGKKGKAHETVVITEVNPSEVHKALESIGLKPGKPAVGEGTKADGPDVNVYIEVTQPDGTAKRLTMDKVLIDPKTKKPMPKGVKFKFTGSGMTQLAPDKPEKVYGADLTGTLIAIFPVTDETVLQTSLTMAEEKYLKLEVNKDVLPKEGDPVKLILEVPGK